MNHGAHAREGIIRGLSIKRGRITNSFGEIMAHLRTGAALQQKLPALSTAAQNQGEFN
jgi:hypothetical protein